MKITNTYIRYPQKIVAQLSNFLVKICLRPVPKIVTIYMYMKDKDQENIHRLAIIHVRQRSPKFFTKLNPMIRINLQ